MDCVGDWMDWNNAVGAALHQTAPARKQQPVGRQRPGRVMNRNPRRRIAGLRQRTQAVPDRLAAGRAARRPQYIHLRRQQPLQRTTALCRDDEAYAGAQDVPQTTREYRLPVTRKPGQKLVATKATTRPSGRNNDGDVRNCRKLFIHPISFSCSSCRGCGRSSLSHTSCPGLRLPSSHGMPP